MGIHQFLLPQLGHASYLVVCEATSEALLIDPQRDISGYLSFAAEHGVSIVGVADTHGHNDYLSGLSAVVAATGARAYAPIGATVGYAAQVLHDRDVIAVGRLEVMALHTPGHTPEHTAFHVQADDQPALISGGSLLAGDVGRPDLLGGTTQITDAARAVARTMRDVIMVLPDETVVYPTHVAGSLCAGAISSATSTTIGQERATNAAVRTMLSAPDAEWFEPDLLPPVPRYWKRMRAQNMQGVEVQDLPMQPPKLQLHDVASAMDEGAYVIDTRTVERFAQLHIEGAINVPASDALTTWVGSIVPEGIDILLVVDRSSDAERIARDLYRIGIGPVFGWMASTDVGAWERSGRAVSSQSRVDWGEARRLVGADGAFIIDVRSPREQAAWPIADSLQIPATLVTREPEHVPRGPVVIACASGMRSSIVASVLRHHGWREVHDLAGGVAFVSEHRPQATV